MIIQPGLISVIMSTYNTSEEYLREAIDSVLNQTYSNFEFIIVDDCSTDNSIEIIESFDDPRIILVKNETNMGITKSLNKALHIAKGEYIARMDADDISLPNRFEKQVSYLSEHPLVIVCGSGVEFFGEGARKHSQKFRRTPLPDNETLRIHLLFGNNFNIVHPTAMFKHQALLNANITYNENYIYAQDYRMWVECSKFGELKNLDEILLKYRVHNNAVSVSKQNIQEECAKNIMAEQLSLIGLKLPDNWKPLHWGLLSERKPFNLDIKCWIKQIIQQNKIHKIYDQRTLEKLLWDKWSEIVYFGIYNAKGLNKLKILFSLPLKYYPNLLKIKTQRSKKEE